MKIFLIIPPNIHYIEPYAYVEADKSNAIRPNLGLLYIAAAVKDVPGVDIRIIDMNLDGISMEALEKLISDEAPDVAGFSVLTFTLLNCMEACKVFGAQTRRRSLLWRVASPLVPEETLQFDSLTHRYRGRE